MIRVAFGSVLKDGDMFIFYRNLWPELLRRDINLRYVSTGRDQAEIAEATFANGDGLITALLYFSLIVRTLFHIANFALQYLWTMKKLLTQPLFLSLIASALWTMIGHAVVSTSLGAMLPFLILDLVFATFLFCVPVWRRPNTRQTHDHRRHPAFG